MPAQRARSRRKRDRLALQLAATCATLVVAPAVSAQSLIAPPSPAPGQSSPPEVTAPPTSPAGTPAASPATPPAGAPPAEAPPAAPGGTPEPPPLPEAPGEKPPETPGPKPPAEELQIIAAPAVGFRWLNGDRADYFQYTRPPTGLFLGLLEATRRAPEGYIYQQFWWRNLFVSDQKGFFEDFNRTHPSYFRFWRQTADFYADPKAPGFNFSHRADTQLRVHSEWLDPSPAIDFYVWNQRVTVPAIARLLPFRAIDYRSTELALTSMRLFAVHGARPHPAPAAEEAPAKPGEPGAPPSSPSSPPGDAAPAAGAPAPPPAGEAPPAAGTPPGAPATPPASPAAPPATPGAAKNPPPANPAEPVPTATPEAAPAAPGEKDAEETPPAMRPLPLADQQLYLEAAYLNFNDLLTVPDRFPDSQSGWVLADYMFPVGSRGDLSFGAQGMTTGVSGEPPATSAIFRMQANARPADWLAVDSFYRHLGVDLPFTETGYAPNRDMAGVNFAVYPRAENLRVRGGAFWERVTRQFGIRDLEILHREGIDTRDESSAWIGGWTRVTADTPGGWHADLRAMGRNLSNPPPAAIPGLPDRGTLYYTDEVRVDARVDRPLGLDWNAYFLYAWNWRENRQRGTTLALNSATAGVTGAATPRLFLTGEVTAQLWDGDKQPYLVGGGRSPLPPRLFFTSAGILTANANYELTARSSMDLSYNYFLSAGGQEAGDSLAILQYRRDVNRNFFYSAGLQFETFRASRPSRSYAAVPLLLEAGWKREFDFPVKRHGPKSDEPAAGAPEEAPAAPESGPTAPGSPETAPAGPAPSPAGPTG